MLIPLQTVRMPTVLGGRGLLYVNDPESTRLWRRWPLVLEQTLQSNGVVACGHTYVMDEMVSIYDNK